MRKNWPVVARAEERTFHPADAFQQSNRIGGTHPLVHCNANLRVNSVAHNVPGARISRRAITDELLEVRDVMWRN